jgi:catechol 2,3-dioxygenase
MLNQAEETRAGSIPPDTTLGPVVLTVADLSRSLDFYRDRLGFKLHRQQDGTAALGAGGADLLVLVEQPGAQRTPRTTGLYHFAVLVPSRLALAHSLRRLIETETPVQGFADHLVSEAIYLPDPDGNGIEIYRDRPRDQWPRVNGQLQMATHPIDLNGILGELTGRDKQWIGLHPDTVIGHMHLHVRNVDEAERFYHEVLGFDKIMRYGPSAAFLSAGGYHHHIGLNTWAGVGAPPPPPESVGLRWFTIQLPDPAARDAIVDRCRQTGVTVEEHDDGLFMRDPSQNGIVLAFKG